MKTLLNFFVVCNFATVFNVCAATPGKPGKAEHTVKFVTEIAETGMLQMKLGQLAQTKGITPEVKALGRTIEDDHSRISEELQTYAESNNIRLPGALSESDHKKYDELATKTGKDFDKAFAACMIKDHKKELSAFKREARNGETTLKTWAGQKTATLRYDLKMSKDASKAVKKNKHKRR
jgi:putative membrane protein